MKNLICLAHCISYRIPISSGKKNGPSGARKPMSRGLVSLQDATGWEWIGWGWGCYGMMNLMNEKDAPGKKW